MGRGAGPPRKTRPAFAICARWQRRILSLINLFALQGLVLAMSAFTVAYSTGLEHLFWSGVITFALKVLFLPWLLHRLIRRLEVYWDTEPLLDISGTMLAGILIVVFSFGLAEPIAHLASTSMRNAIGIAVAVVLLAAMHSLISRGRDA